MTDGEQTREGEEVLDDAEAADNQFRERLRHSQKMKALGQLTSGIAHDFNNLLTLITGYSRVLLDEVDPHTSQYAHVEKIARASKQATELVSQLLAFGRDGDTNMSVVNLNDLLRDFEAMLERIIGDNITLEARLDPELENVRLDPNRLDQVLMNLTVNARDAMPDGGRLVFETSNAYLGRSRPASLHRLPPGPYVKLAVSDDGCGMSQETMGQIFEPFYTTKELGEGTGLGLATARSIVRQFGGAIRVDSAVSEGTCFELYFPPADTSVEAGLDWTVPALQGSGDEHILLADEHSEVRKLTADILANRGYRITQMGLYEALTTKFDDDFSLVIIDRGVSTPASEELAERLCQDHANLKVLFLSGYDCPEPASSDIRVLQKPFTPDALTSAVRELLDVAD